MFSSRSIMISNLTFKSSVHFELIFCIWCQKMVHFYSFTCIHPGFLILLMKKAVFSSFISFPPLLQINWPYKQASILGLLFYSSIGLLMLVPYCLNYYSFIIQFEIKSMIIPDLFFFLINSLLVQNHLCSHTSFRIISMKNFTWISPGIALTLQISLSSIDIFIIFFQSMNILYISIYLFISNFCH